MQLQFFNHPEGYVEPTVVGGTRTEKSVKGFSIGGGSGTTTYSDYKYVFQFKDHLGNVRLSYSDNDLNGSIDPATEIIEESNYYPFGLEQKGYNNVVAGGNDLAQNWKFGGKEYNQELGLNWYDVSARNYDPALGRWMNIDPLAEQMRRHSPYNYAFDNPVYFIDYDGMMPFGSIDGISNNFLSNEFEDRMNAKSQEQRIMPERLQYISAGNASGGDPGDPPNYYGPSVAVGAINPLPEVCIGCDSTNDEGFDGNVSVSDASKFVGATNNLIGARAKYNASNWKNYYGTVNKNADELAALTRSASNKLAKRSFRAGIAIDVAFGSVEIYNGYQLDGGSYGYNSQRATAGVVGNVLGGLIGTQFGKIVGGALGTEVPAIGNAAGVFTGGLVFGIIGSELGGEVAKNAFDNYNKK